LAWTIEYTDAAKRQLKKLDKSTARRIVDYLDERVSGSTNPRAQGEPLRGPLGEFWKYRIGDYRVCASIEDARLCVLVVRVGHRREVYR
jgi:mRNA interferase RelE/StbE